MVLPEPKATSRSDIADEKGLFPDSLVGSYFHSAGKPIWQGQVVARPEPGYYLVETFSWISGASTSQHLVRVENMIDWMFYDTASWMQFSYEHGMAATLRRQLEGDTP